MSYEQTGLRFVNGNNEPLYLSEEISILFTYCIKVKSKIVINGKATLFMESYKSFGIFLQEMYANKIFYKNKKIMVGGFFNGRAGMLTNYFFFIWPYQKSV